MWFCLPEAEYCNAGAVPVVDTFTLQRCTDKGRTAQQSNAGPPYCRLCFALHCPLLSRVCCREVFMTPAAAAHFFSFVETCSRVYITVAAANFAGKMPALKAALNVQSIATD